MLIQETNDKPQVRRQTLLLNRLGFGVLGLESQFKDICDELEELVWSRPCKPRRQGLAIDCRSPIRVCGLKALAVKSEMWPEIEIK